MEPDNQPETSSHPNFFSFIKHGETSNVQQIYKEIQINKNQSKMITGQPQPEMDAIQEARIKSKHIIDPRDMNEHDPPLTKKGIQKALTTGLFFKNFIKDNRLIISQVHIQSSPYIGALMTANGIAQAFFGDQCKVQILVDSHLSK